MRILASTSGAPATSVPSPANAVVAEWIDYSEAMPEAALVISNGTHGTIVQALGLGVPLAIAPAMPDDAEHGIRVSLGGRRPQPAAAAAVGGDAARGRPAACSPTAGSASAPARSRRPTPAATARSAARS